LEIIRWKTVKERKNRYSMGFYRGSVGWSV